MLHNARSRILVLPLAAVLALSGAACADGNGGTATPAGSAETGSVTIKLIAFTPTRLEVPVGSAVTWRQDDVATHTVTSGRVEQAGGTVTAKPDGTFDSGNISKGQNFRFTFPEAGEFPFFCAIHPATMTGVVVVA